MKMNVKDKNESKRGAKSKILVLGLILIILVGLLSPMAQVRAQSSFPVGYRNPVGMQTPEEKARYAKEDAEAAKASADKAAASTAAGKDAFKKEIIDGCGAPPWTWFNGCLLLVFYYTIFQLPSWSAQVFHTQTIFRIYLQKFRLPYFLYHV